MILLHRVDTPLVYSYVSIILSTSFQPFLSPYHSDVGVDNVDNAIKRYKLYNDNAMLVDVYPLSLNGR